VVENSVIGPALFRRYPELRASLPIIPLAGPPTPIERVELPDHPGIWVKRDDLTAPGYGGNKVRKLEFLLGRARARGARRLVTVGAAGSHHAMATALYGRQHGFAVSLVLFPQPLTDHVREVLLTDLALGAELRWAPRMELIPAAAWLARVARRADDPILLPAGGSDAVGTLGYVSAALELAEQVDAGLIPEPDVVHVAAGTLGTAAGLALGFSLAGMKTRVHAIRIASALVTNERNLTRLVRGAAAILAASGIETPDAATVLTRVALSHDAIGAGYGHATEAGRAASDSFSGTGLSLDPTYTGKAAAAALARASREPGSVHLYWHTLSAAQPELPAPLPDSTGLPRRFRDYLGV
jgi:1-aminocyclopropane-1-carboxylate deaminase/D-cysteine desulfhydrase-like pyridoxal-dependent ACC family enzyme